MLLQGCQRRDLISTTSPLSKLGIAERSNKRGFASLSSESDSFEPTSSAPASSEAAPERLVKVARRLFLSTAPQRASGAPPIRTVTDIYQLQSLRIDPLYTLQVETLLQHIEKIASQENFSSHPQNSLKSIRAYITQLLHKGEEIDRGKRAELQMIAFYLDRDQELPLLNGWVIHCASFVEYRIHELLSEIKCLKQEATIPLEMKNSIASGRNYYLRRAFARMAVTSNLYEGNPLYLGTAAQYHILTEFTHITAPILNLFDEGSLHFLMTITKELEDISKYQNVLGKEIQLSRSMEHFFKLAHLLPAEAELTPSLVSQALVMALLFNTYQIFPNCYAVTAEAYMKKNETLLFLEKMVEWFESGLIKIEGFSPFPIDLLAGHRFFYEPQLELLIEQPQHELPAPMHYILNSHGMQMDEEFLKGPKTLLDILRLILQKFSQEEKMGHIAECYNAVYYDPIIGLTAAIIEFYSLNKDDKTSLNPSYNLKHKLIKIFMRFMSEGCTKSNNITKKLKGNLLHNFWLSYKFNENVTKTSSGIILSKIKEDKICASEDLKKLLPFFKKSTLLWVLEGAEYKAIKHISELENYIKNSLIETLDSIEEPDKIVLEILIKDQKDFVMNFCRYLSRKLNKLYEINIPPESLKEINLCLILSRGSDAIKALKSSFDVELKSHNLGKKHSKLERVMDRFSTCVETPPKRSDHLISCDSHVWLYQPSSPYNNLSFSLAAKQQIIETANKKLKSLPGQGFLRHLFSKLTFSEEGEMNTRVSYYSKKNISYLIKNLFKDKNILISKKTLSKVLNQEIYKVKLRSQHLKELNLKLNFPLGEEEELVGPLKTYIDLKSSLPLSTRQIALYIRKFILKNSQLLLSSLAIEEKICQMQNLPAPFFLGYTNWNEKDYTERFDPKLYRVRYDFVRQKIGVAVESSSCFYFDDSKVWSSRFLLISKD